MNYDELTEAAHQLDTAKRATAKFRDISVDWGLLAFGETIPAQGTTSHHMSAAVDRNGHACTVRVTYDDLTKTAKQLEIARQATAKYRDIRVARADGYSAYGIYVPGMGIHYAKPPSKQFDLQHPDVLLHERDGTAPEGYALVAVSYFFEADADPIGQPNNPPFANSLATWHQHDKLCVFSDRSVSSVLSETQCKTQGGMFVPSTPWMLHLWIWKDNPLGLFSMTNPNVQ